MPIEHNTPHVEEFKTPFGQIEMNLEKARADLELLEKHPEYEEDVKELKDKIFQLMERLISKKN